MGVTQYFQLERKETGFSIYRNATKLLKLPTPRNELEIVFIIGADFFKEIMMIQGYSQYRNHTDMTKMVRMIGKKMTKAWATLLYIKMSPDQDRKIEPLGLQAFLKHHVITEFITPSSGFLGNEIQPVPNKLSFCIKDPRECVRSQKLYQELRTII